MRNKNSKPDKKKTSSKRNNTSAQSHEYETMSQIQNRYGNGRRKTGSDGGSGNEGFSNH